MSQDKAQTQAMPELPIVSPGCAAQLPADSPAVLVPLPSGMNFIHDPERPDRLERMLDEYDPLPD